MTSINHATLVAIATVLCAGLPADAGAQSASLRQTESTNPACTLLTLQEIRTASGQNYDGASPGDELGEGAGGGASCQWGGPSFVPGKDHPLLSLVIIPPGKWGSYTESSLKAKAREGCARETVRGLGDLGFVQSCATDRGPVAYAKAGKYDLIVQMDAKAPASAASVTPAVLAVAKAAAAKLRTKS